MKFGIDFLPEQLDTIQALRKARKDDGREEPDTYSITISAPTRRENWLMDIILNHEDETVIESYRCYWSMGEPRIQPWTEDTTPLQ